MEASDYNNIYLQLYREVNSLKNTRAEIEAALADINNKIERLDETIEKIAPLAGFTFLENSITKLGITDAARKVLDLERDVWMSVGDIKSKMTDLGYDLSKYSAPDSSIHTTLKRLVEAGKVESKKEDWRVFFKFKGTDDDIPF